MRLVDATRGIVTAADLARMKPTALWSTPAARRSSRPARWCARCRPGVPAWPPSMSTRRAAARHRHPLLDMDNVVCTPHIGYVTREEYEVQFSDIFDQIIAYVGGKPMNVVNPKVLEREDRHR
jgi:D-3-phosphoglycerate dehydrogenase